jgi:hypothetical protein
LLAKPKFPEINLVSCSTPRHKPRFDFFEAQAKHAASSFADTSKHKQSRNAAAIVEQL